MRDANVDYAKSRTSMRMRKMRHWISLATPPHTRLCRLASIRPSTEAAATDHTSEDSAAMLDPLLDQASSLRHSFATPHSPLLFDMHR